MKSEKGGEVVVEYGYDDNGNLLSRTEGNETVNYVWDDRNRLVAVEENGERVEFEYDDDNIRVSQTVGGEKTSFLLDNNRPYAQVLAEFVDGEEVASYVYGLDLISQQRNGVDAFYFVDGLGSTRGLTDSEGEVTDAYWYDAYGNLVERVGNSENDYLFAGEQFDEQLEQYYLRQRYYDPATGRFTRRDTWEGRLEEPITLNKYLYGNGNPVNGIDPTGLFTMTEISAANSIANILNEIQFNNAIRFAAVGAGDENAGKVGTVAGDYAFDLFAAYSPIGKALAVASFVGMLSSGIFPEDFELDKDAKRIAKQYFVDKNGEPDKHALSGRTVAVGRIHGTGQRVVAVNNGSFTRQQQQELEAQGYKVIRESPRKGTGKPHFDAERRLIRNQYDSQGKKIYQLEAIGANRPLCSFCWAHMQLEGIRRGSPLKAKPFKRTRK